MIKLNLLPPQEKQSIAAQIKQRWIVFYGSAVIGLLCFFAILLSAIWAYIDIQLNVVQNNLASIQNDIRGQDLKNQQTAVKNLNSYLQKIQSIQKNQKSYSTLLNYLAQMVPDGIRIDSLSLENDGNATLNGFAQRREQIIAFQESLEKSNIFGNVESPVANLVKPTDINFSFKFKIQPAALIK